MFLLSAKVRKEGRTEGRTKDGRKEGRTDGRTDGSITISRRNFVGEGIELKNVHIGHRCFCCY